jgi:hypothetical protein
MLAIRIGVGSGIDQPPAEPRYECAPRPAAGAAADVAEYTPVKARYHACATGVHDDDDRPQASKA